VLLKNDNKLLPLKTATAGGPKTIAVVGFGANSTSSSINRYSGHPQTSTSVWDGMSAAAVAGGGKAVLGGGDSSALALVKTADVAVVVVSGEAEGESHDRQQLGLPPDQLAFLSSLIETKVPLVVCIISGGAVDVTLAKQHAQAVIAMYSGGMEAGAALADVVFGAVNPSGVLAAGIYRANCEQLALRTIVYIVSCDVLS
jgi:beta-glucosidase